MSSGGFGTRSFGHLRVAAVAGLRRLPQPRVSGSPGAAEPGCRRGQRPRSPAEVRPGAGEGAGTEGKGMEGDGPGRTRAGAVSASFRVERCFLGWSACVCVSACICGGFVGVLAGAPNSRLQTLSEDLHDFFP